MKNKTLNSTFIVTPNPVDYLTFAGIALSSGAAALIVANRFSLALALLFLAMLADALDGILARKMGLMRDFGRYLDGFADVFNYLTVPSFFLFMWGFNTWYYGIVLIVFIICGVIRLSVFNEIGNIKDSRENLSYLGMPVFWSVLFVGMLYIAGWFLPPGLIYAVTALVFLAFSFCMILNRPFFKFKSLKVILGLILGFAAVFALEGFGAFPAEKLSGAGQHLTTTLFVLIPAITGGSLHMMAVSKNWLPFLAVPVSRPFFGANKTFRGFVLMPAFCILGAFVVKGILLVYEFETTFDISGISPFVFGGAIGFAYILSELPNSFIKRRMGAAPGETPERFRPFFIFLDQFDSVLGISLMTWLFFQAPPATTICMIIAMPPVAVGVKRILFILKWKKTSM